ncbi:DNA cytosine methyltransferase [Azospirillum sp. TSO5]|uniref:DNA cytosine methyltransferase n=1 Tax=Azospirillum sp. TSO5 TaxID=716760 RepID=UPI000D62216E|nr:DNA cytosine methyltransferase [Azospirillum sp. TSO5]PWC92883.1 hypothetical protein TSO5_15745 [Azospirillum sp. TSO5]
MAKKTRADVRPDIIGMLTKAAALAKPAASGDADSAKALKAVLDAVEGQLARLRADAEKAVAEAEGRKSVLTAAMRRYLAGAYDFGADDVPVFGVIGDATPKTYDDGMGTLRAQQGGEGNVAAYLLPQPAGAFREAGFGRWAGTDVGETLRASGGSFGGGSETVVAATPGAYVENSRSEVREVEGGVAACLTGPAGKNFNIIAGAFMGGQGAKAGSVAYSETVSPTLKSSPSGSNQIPSLVEQSLPVGPCHARQAEPIRLCHPTTAGTLLASGAGMSRPAGCASETDLVVAHPVLACGDDFYCNKVSVAEMDYAQLKAAVKAEAGRRQRRHRVRRLTPIETARLQGMPDWWHAVPAPEGKRPKAMSPSEVAARRRMYAEIGLDFTESEIAAFASDGDAYKGHGNSMAVPVMRFIFTKTVDHVRERRPDFFVPQTATARPSSRHEAANEATAVSA